MSASVRRRMVRSWGPCPRHAWAQAIVEIELRGGVPFTIAILYADLVTRAARALVAADASQAQHVLAPRDACVTCDYCEFAEPDTAFAERTQRANQRRRVGAMLAATRFEWEPAACPTCVPGAAGLPCRPHLVARQADLVAGLPGYLDGLAERLHVFQKSMTWRGPTATAAERASWVEALGFFAGWRAPFLLAGWPHARPRP